MEKKTIIIVVISLLVVVLSVSFAWFSIEILGEHKEVTVNSKSLNIQFTNGDKISASNIEPGWSTTSSFKVTSNTDTTYNYNITLENYINTFVTNGYLQYKITSDNGGYNMTEYKDLPKSETSKNIVIAYNASIASGVTQNYVLDIQYFSSDTVDQSDDMGKTLSGKLYIAAGTEPPYNNFTEETLAYKMFSDNPIIATRSSYSNIFSDNNTGTLYKSTEKVLDNDAVDVYYYAGNISNNWVKFGKNENDEDLYWRIIRTNADGSVRLLYHGTGTDSTEAYITTNAFNKIYNKSMYVGYMYGTSDSQVNARVNTNNSDIKNIIDSWYEKTLLIKTDDSGNTYDSYLSTTAVYCNDRTVGSGTWCENCNTTFYYKGYSRLNNAKTPTYDCTNENDAFSVSNTNAQLTHPVALMTADEVVFAGGRYGTNNPSVWYYLNSEGNASTNTQYWWLLSPLDWYSSGWSYVFGVYGSTFPGILDNNYVNYAYGVRPTVSVKSNVRVLSGNGTAQSPYTLGL